MRRDAGVTLTELARVVDVHRSHIARIESGSARPSIAVLTAIGVALGADMSLRFFSGTGPRLHDRFQAVMVEAFLRSVAPRWSIEVEVPINQPSRGVIDIVLTDRRAGLVIAAEAQSQVNRLEQQIRWMAEKAEGLAGRVSRDEHAPPSEVSRLLILRSTMDTREIARRLAATLAAAYPAKTRHVVQALSSTAARWPGARNVWMNVEADKAELMRFPPRGVALGR